MFVMIDNYDSFTFNLVQYFGQLGVEMRVFRNDEITPDALEKLNPTAIVISPGPGTPQDAGISVEVVKRFGVKIPVLGVCLGHQAIGYAFGGRIGRSAQIVHGKASSIRHNGAGIFKGVRSPLKGGRYHSLIVEKEGFPDCLEVTAENEKDGEIMALAHKTYPVFGIQFHPESILTPGGKRVLKRFIEIVKNQSV